MNPPSNSLSNTFAQPDLPLLTSRLALAAAVIVLAMFGIFLFTGVGQDPLQYIHTPQEYVAILLKNPPILRLAVGLDNLFIVLYSSMFLVLGASLWKRAGSRVLLLAALSLLALSGLLDMLENMHFLTLISTALQGMEISLAQIKLQAWESLVKFHVSYLGLFLLGFAMPNQTLLEKALCFAFRWVQLPVGLLIYLTPPAIAIPLVLTRFTFFFLSLVAISLIFRQRKFGSDAPG
ncbi:MAG: hypothetical protein HY066_02540 [Betaproteobacteria bacterium]|nr:hypothetical protein [Betaproteobacteria bacterium]